MTDKNKPILTMSEEECSRALSEIGDPINRQILEEARRASEPVTVAMAILTLASGERRIAYPLCEYGDGEAIGNVRDFVKNARRLLRPGESLVTYLATISLSQLSPIPDGAEPKESRS